MSQKISHSCLMQFQFNYLPAEAKIDNYFFIFKVTVDVKQNRCILVLLFPFSKYLFLTYAIYVVSYVEKKLYMILHTCIFQYYHIWVIGMYYLLVLLRHSIMMQRKQTCFAFPSEPPSIKTTKVASCGQRSFSDRPKLRDS